MTVRAGQAKALRRATVRSVHWPPAMVAVLVVAGMVAWRDESLHELGSATLAGRTVAVLLTVGVVFVLDDAAAVTVAASPTPLWWRRLLRYFVAGLFLVPAWSGFLGYAVQQQPALPWTRLTLELAALVVFGFAVAVAATRWSDDTDPGMTAALAVLGVVFLLSHLPPTLAFFALPGTDTWQPSTYRWLALSAFALAVLVIGSRDPAHRHTFR